MTEPTNSIESQLAPSGILCDSCPLGSGTLAESACQTRKHIADCQIPAWSPLVPGGEAIDWKAVDRALDWMITCARCAGCQSGGGPPGCTIRICAGEGSYELCSYWRRSGGLHQVQAARDYGQVLREKLKDIVGRFVGMISVQATEHRVIQAANTPMFVALMQVGRKTGTAKRGFWESILGDPSFDKIHLLGTNRKPIESRPNPFLF